MSNGMKEQENLQINLVGNEGMKCIMAIANGDAEVRGRITNSQYKPPGK
jgi:hypothetical protein